jgi:hypothetical protein
MDPTVEPIATTNPSPNRNRSPAAVRGALAWDRVMLRNDLRLYIRQAWHLIEPATVYLENWHIDLIAEHLEALPGSADGPQKRVKLPGVSLCSSFVGSTFTADPA